MSRYLTIVVDPKSITALEYQCDQPEDNCKYAETFDTWNDLLSRLWQYLDGYMWVTIRKESR